MTNLVAQQVVRELDEIVKVDGGRLRVRQATDADESGSKHANPGPGRAQTAW